MCGIAGFSLATGSKQNARQLAHSLLSQIERRGHHASGFAYVTRDGKLGNYKQPKPGSQLSLAELPRNAKTVILHTRYATQGSPEDNRNNHPVISTDNKIALVHNGVINNDERLREPLGITDRHGQVDSLVIPSLIAQHGVKALDRLGGYAAIAWLDAREGDGTLHIARLKNSPVSFTWLFDGSFVFASTSALLQTALYDINANFGGVFDLADGRMIDVIDGFILTHEEAPRMQYSYQTYSRYSGATAGGHGTSHAPATGVRSSYQQPTGAPANKVGEQPATQTQQGAVGTVGSEVVKVTTDPEKAASGAKGSEDADPRPKSGEGAEYTDVDAYLADLEEWRARRAAQDVTQQEASLKAIESGPTMALGMISDLDDEDEEDAAFAEYIRSLAEAQAQIEAEQNNAMCTVAGRYMAKEGYYIIDSDGDISGYPTLDDLEARLRWLNGMRNYEGMPVPDAADEIRWVNFIIDMGHLDDNGELVSWVDDMAEVDAHESDKGELQYVRDGISRVEAMIKG